MRIRRLQLRAFAGFTDYEIDLGEPGTLAMIYGPNEAGKTTVLRAIKDFLYGIPTRSGDSFHHAPNQLRLAAVLEGKDGQQLTLVRRKGNKNTLLDTEEKPVADGLLEPWLGSIDRYAFSMMFGIDHHSLRQGGEDLLKGQGALEQALFVAASGLGHLSEIGAELQKEASALFKPSGSRPPINVNVNRYRSLKKESTQLALTPQLFSDLEAQYLSERRDVARLKQEEEVLLVKKARLERLAITLPLLARRRQHRQDIEALGAVVALDEESKEARLRWQNQRDTARASQRRAQEESRELMTEIQELVIEYPLIDHAPEISFLHERLDTYRRYVRDMPAKRAEKAELEETALILLSELNPKLSSLERVESLRIPLVDARQIRALAQRYPVLKLAFASATERVEKLKQALHQKKQALEKLGTVPDVQGAQQLVMRLQKKGDLETEVRDGHRLVKIMKDELASRRDALGLWSGPLHRLPHVALPLEETVRSFASRHEGLNEQSARLRERCEETRAHLAELRERLHQEVVPGDATSEKEVESARRRRQTGWNLVRSAWLQGHRDEAAERAFAGSEALAVAYELSVLKADELADLLRRDASLAARNDVLLRDINRTETRLKEWEEEGQSMARELLCLEQQWQDCWRESGITPLTPVEMMGWLSRCRELVDGISQLREKGAAVQQLEQEICAHRAALEAALVELGHDGASALGSFDLLLQRVQAVLQECQDKCNLMSRLQGDIERVEEEESVARHERDLAQQALMDWQGDWACVMERSGLDRDAHAEAVGLYLEQLQKLLHTRDEVVRRQREVNDMRDECRDFDVRLSELCEKLGSPWTDTMADQMVLDLVERANRAQRQRDRRQSLEERLQGLEGVQRQAALDVQAAEEGLQGLVRRARCQQESELPQAEKRYQELRRLQAEMIRVEEQLLEHGSGMSLSELEKEAQGIAGDGLSGQLHEVEAALAQNRETQDVINQRFGATRKEYEDKVQGVSMQALKAAEQAQSVLSELRRQSEQYIRLRLAALLLQRGLERYRQENQNPVVAEAGRLFSRLTDASFSRLLVDFNDKDHPVLVGLRGDGQRVPVEGMSDGTLDQLYLALRLASLDRYLAENEPLPLILDDVLVHFDDRRSERTLEVLGEFAQRTQVIFFTHHKHCLELSRRAVPWRHEIELRAPDR